ncbi:Membrane-associated kinase regulator [Actinidia chinensis var. chinensis]|uniref:Membrane-associated kinase regulator n=1 Tax=Actinidia chinensis var. chinensis TaxID=1590841 RepID=A0A2R6PHX4_ACTCC|nr:Membrane-associated kinase regulator [Actinidia chinensis var. chinensis]
MEAFTLLKFWKGADGGGNNLRSSTTCSTKILTAVSHHSTDTEDDNYDDDEGPFFDLEFTLDDGGEQAKHEDRDCTDDGGEGREDADVESDEGTDDEDEREEFKFSLSSGDPNLSLSPSDDLFFDGSESNAKPQVSLLKSATKFRVLMLKLKKSKAEKPVSKQKNQSQSKFFTVKFKVEEAPIVSLFTRDNSSRSTNKSQKQQNSDESASDEKKLSKDVMQKYLKLVKPLYIRASKRHAGKMSSPPAKSAAEKSESEVRESSKRTKAKREKQGNLSTGLLVVCKHLGKSGSASEAAESTQAKRRDDSLWEQQDGIQSAILHCKRSFNASRDSSSSLL